LKVINLKEYAMDTEGIRRRNRPESFMVARENRHSPRYIFRRAMRAAVGATMLGMAAAASTVFATASLFPANAQTVTKDAPVTLKTDCMQYARDRLKAGHLEIGDDALCAAEQKRLATEENKQAHQREKQIDNLHACIDQLVSFKNGNPEGFNALKQSLKVSKITDENACQLSGRIPKPTAANPGVRPWAG
jgi:hypothetical protein